MHPRPARMKAYICLEVDGILSLFHIQEADHSEQKRVDAMSRANVLVPFIAYPFIAGGPRCNCRHTGQYVASCHDLQADRAELGRLEAVVSSRVSMLESAILKGLQAVSDKASAALTQKLDVAAFNEFKVKA